VKILVCGADDIVFILDLCLCLFILFDLFLISFRLILLFCGAYFIINDLVYFIDWDIITLNGRSIMVTFLFEWISLLFMGFVFIIYSLVILYSDDNMFGDLNTIRFISLVLIFVVSIIFLIVSPNVITAGLVTFRATYLICLGSICKLTSSLFVAE